MAAPIILWNPKLVKESDDAGNCIIKTTLPPPVTSVPRYLASDPTQHRVLTRVPRLASFCIRVLSEYPEQLHVIGDTRPHFDSGKGGTDDVLRAVLPKWKTPRFSLLDVDPRLWATIIQVYRNLPDIFSSYPCQLSDPHVPLLNQIPCTPDFALITVLELRKSSKVTDDNIILLKSLHNLSALDLTVCQSVSSRGIEALSRTLTFNELGEKRGPWGLRILRLRGCMKVDKKIFDSIRGFPLLSVIDLRNSRCTVRDIRRPFFSASNVDIFELPLVEALKRLSQSYPFMFSADSPFVFSLEDRPETNQLNTFHFNPPTRSVTSKHNNFVVLPPSCGSTFSGRPMARTMQFGNVDTKEFLEKKAEREERERRKREREGGQYVEARCSCGCTFCGEHSHLYDSDVSEENIDSDVSEEDIDSDEDNWNDDDSDGSDARLLSVLRESTRRTVETQLTVFLESPIISTPELPQMQSTGAPTAASTDMFYQQRSHSPMRSWLGRADQPSSGLALLRVPPAWHTLDSITPDTIRTQGGNISSDRRGGSQENRLLLNKKRKAPMQVFLQAELSKRRKIASTTNTQEANLVDTPRLSAPPSPTSTVCDAVELSARRGPPLRPISNLRAPERSSFSYSARLKLEPAIESTKTQPPRPSTRFSGVARKARCMSLAEGFKVQAQRPDLSPFTGVVIKPPMPSEVKSQSSKLARGKDPYSSDKSKNWKSAGLGL